MTRSTLVRSVRTLLWLALLAATACQQTEIAFENDLPGAKLENLKWKPPGETYSSEGTLSPGQTSESVYVYEEDIDASGVIEFDLVQNGRRVHLTTREKFAPVEGEMKVFTIREDTPVENGVDDGG